MGEVSKEIPILIRLAPTVQISPKELIVEAGKTATFECAVEGTKGEFNIVWDVGGNVLRYKVIKVPNLNRRNLI